MSDAGQSDQVGEVLSAVIQMARLNPDMPVDEIVRALRESYMVIPRAEYHREVEQIGEWQDRARRVINAANAVADTYPGTDRNEALARLGDVLYETEFRVADDDD